MYSKKICNKESKFMTENEIKLLETIKNHSNPEQAMLTAIEIILSYLNHHESSVSEPSVVIREFDGTSQAMPSHSR